MCPGDLTGYMWTVKQMDEWTDMTMVIVTFKCEDTLKGLNIQFVVIILLFFPKCEK
jgi:hypothetical protein